MNHSDSLVESNTVTNIALYHRVHGGDDSIITWSTANQDGDVRGAKVLASDGHSLRAGGASRAIHSVGVTGCAAGDGGEGGLMVTDKRNRRREEGSTIHIAADDDRLAQSGACGELTSQIANVDVRDVEAVH